MLCKVQNLGQVEICGEKEIQYPQIRNAHASWTPTNRRESAPERLNKEIMKIKLLGQDSIR